MFILLGTFQTVCLIRGVFSSTEVFIPPIPVNGVCFRLQQGMTEKTPLLDDAETKPSQPADCSHDPGVEHHSDDNMQSLDVGMWYTKSVASWPNA